MPAHLFALVRAASPTGLPWLFLAMTAIILVGVVFLAFFLLRRLMSDSASKASDKDRVPRAENEPAFMTASMQAVIQKLRDQEKELERLHKIERERAETTARFSEEVARNMPAGLLVVSDNGLITSSNPAAEQALGIRTLAFRRFSEALGESSTLSRLLAQCLSEGTVFRREQATHITRDGTVRELGVTISPIRRGQEKAGGVICLLSDLTELAALQKQMRLRDNLAALGELSAGIAHEFKNALATISGYAQMIHSDPSAADTPENAAKILDQTRQITHVVTEFLRYARPLEISAEPVDLGALLQRTIAEVREQFSQVQFCSEGTFADVAGDEGLLRQAFLNLIRNAAEAAATSSSQPSVAVLGVPSRASAETWQRIHVRDNGPGIPTEALPRLFLPFFTTKAGGTGLGLAVVQKILVQHGGQIEARNRNENRAESAAPPGAEFIVTLPIVRRLAEAVESKEAAI